MNQFSCSDHLSGQKMYRVCLLWKVRFGQKIHIIVYLIVECVNSIKICNCFCNSCSFSGSSKKGFECVVYKNIFWPFSQNCQGQHGIFTFSVLWVQVTLESKQQLVKKLNEFVQNRHVYTWFIQTFKLTPLHSCSENTKPWWFIGLLGLWAIPFFFSMTSVFILLTSSYNFMVMTKLAFLISQHR